MWHGITPRYRTILFNIVTSICSNALSAYDITVNNVRFSCTVSRNAAVYYIICSAPTVFQSRVADFFFLNILLIYIFFFFTYKLVFTSNQILLHATVFYPRRNRLRVHSTGTNHRVTTNNIILL